MQFNLSEWALGHRSFVVYCMLALIAVGLLSYYRLGRNEDPAFTFRTMVVQAAWPGATLNDTLDQVTERIERKLQETPHLDFLRSFTSAGSLLEAGSDVDRVTGHKRPPVASGDHLPGVDPDAHRDADRARFVSQLAGSSSGPTCVVVAPAARRRRPSPRRR